MSLSTLSLRSAVIGGMLAAMAFANPLDAYRDQHRLIVVSLPTAESAQTLTAALKSFRAEIDDRDLKIIDVSPSAALIPDAVRLTNDETAQLRKRFQLNADEKRAVFILIGKDGGEKARQHGSLDLKQWFALIDQMPMRRQEMKRR